MTRSNFGQGGSDVSWYRLGCVGRWVATGLHKEFVGCRELCFWATEVYFTVFACFARRSILLNCSRDCPETFGTPAGRGFGLSRRSLIWLKKRIDVFRFCEEAEQQHGVGSLVTLHISLR